MSSGKKGPGKGPGIKGEEPSGHRPFQEALRNWKVDSTKPSPAKLARAASVAKSPPKSKPRVESAKVPTAPRQERGYQDAVALRQAYQGVRPLDGSDDSSEHRVQKARRLPKPAPSLADNAARDRLAAMVSRGLSFRVEVDDDGFVRGFRKGGERTLKDSSRLRGAATAELDLHGLREADAVRSLVQFVRDARRQGHSFVRIIQGKGRHSVAGAGVLADAAVRALTSDRLAHGVWAFCSEPSSRPPPGALIVALVRQGRSE